MSAGDIKLGEKDLETLLTHYGRTYNEGTIEIIRERRTVSGTLVSDLIAKKKKFTITYSEIKGQDLEDILDLYNMDKELSLIVTDRQGTDHQYDVKLAPLNMKRVSILDDWFWANVTLDLEEI
jgi:hypothetical protein